MVLVASRVDAAGAGERLSELRRFCRSQNLLLLEISAVTGQGLEELKLATWSRLQEVAANGNSRSAPEVHSGQSAGAESVR